ncbi:MAG: hypothetical protein AUK54_07725 [Helicobacteraceae bacterium CG2_30_36_10]|nr:MAG: hypothetical protein AUK54_07725 [Helicobacteraceae bacterium CG2_30_36_10]
MSQAIEKLKEIGAQKIHETTHISKLYIQGMLHETLDDMNRIQFFGFISILEREYHIDLAHLREKGNKYFNEISHIEDSKNKIFAAPKKKTNYSLFYITIAVLIFIAVTAFTITNFSSAQTDKKVEVLDNSNIDSATQNMTLIVDKLNATTIEDENLSVMEEEIEPEAVLPPKSLKIIPNIKVWVGYIDLQTYKKYQKIVSDELVLDPEKNWILVCGHGDLNIEANSEIHEFKDKNNLKFSYIDGVLKKITYNEFKNLNRGNKW